MSTQIDVLDDNVVPFYPATPTKNYTERDLLLRLLALLSGGQPSSVADGSNVALGAKANAAVIDPTASASAIALLKGLLTEILLTVPASNAAVVAPSDTVNLANSTRAIFITADGDVKVNMAGSGSGVVFVGLKAGMTLPIRAARVLATGTTASVVALW